LPRRVRLAVDWLVTIVAAVALVLAIKAWVVNPYRIPSSSMESTLHCARPESGCQARFSDRVLANRFIYHFTEPERGDIVVFETTDRIEQRCMESGTFVKRIVGLPGETVTVNGDGFVSIDGRRLDEPYVDPDRRGGTFGTWRVAEDSYFMLGDNRRQSCDSRSWESLPEEAIIGEVFAIYWPPQRIGLAAILLGTSLLTLGFRAGRRPPSR
jgi:signal peptidase I